MNECRFVINYRGSLEGLYSKIKSLAEANAAVLDGDSTQGSFEIFFGGKKFAGRYAVAGTNILISIHVKPAYIPCSLIESWVKQYWARMTDGTIFLAI